MGNVKIKSFLVRLVISAMLLLQVSWTLHASNPDSMGINIQIIGWDIYSPDAVSGLTATSAAEGWVQLGWTEPGDDGMVGSASTYEVRHSSTGNINDDSEYSLASIWQQNWQPGSGGSVRTDSVSGLMPGVTYYWALKAKDDIGQSGTWSRTGGVNQNNYCVIYDTTPVKPTNLALVSKTTSSVSIRWDNMHSPAQSGYADFDYYRIYRSTASGIYGSSIAITTSINYTDSSVIINTSYYYRISAVDLPPLVLESDLSDPLTVYVSPIITQPPSGVISTIIDGNNFTVKWNAVANASEYYIWVSSSDSGPWTKISTKTVAEYSGTFDELASILALREKYYLVVTAVASGTESGKSAVTTLIPPPPGAPSGVVVTEVDENNRTFTIKWYRVENATSYMILTSTSQYGPWTSTATVPATGAEYLEWTGYLADGLNYYVVRTKNKFGKESGNSEITKIKGPPPPVIIEYIQIAIITTILESKATVEMYMPVELKNDLIVKIDELKIEDKKEELEKRRGDICLYEINAYKESNKQVISKLPRVIRQVIYYSSKEESAKGMSAQKYKDSAIGGLSNVCVYWHNGIEWEKMGGKVETISTEERKVTFYVINTGKYKLAQTLVTGELEVVLYPEKIFAPRDSNDTLNKMIFKVTNDGNKKLSGKIYDLTGAVVSDIKIDTDGSITGASYPLDGMYWDGQDSNGNYVRGGVYIYQIEMEGKVVNGTIVVAK